MKRLFTEHTSGGRWDRPVLHRLLDQLRPGDVVVVWKRDRLVRPGAEQARCELLLATDQNLRYQQHLAGRRTEHRVTIN